MSVLTHVLWDWNGTLLDDLDAAIDAMNRVLAASGLPLLDRARYRSVFGFPVQDYYGRLGFGPEHGTFEDWARAFLDAYDRGASGIPIRREARAILTRLKGAGLRQVVLSAARAGHLQEMITWHELGDFFEELLGRDDHHASGKLDVARAWIERTGVDPARLLLVGDTMHDYEVAREIGAHCVLIAEGHHGEARLRACDCAVLGTLEDLYTADTPVRAYLAQAS
ncbi:MAG TPA: HAD family hydrolase [Kofleriaceae bacterium]|nr:HAD family hydrolase [Kofleriaceae bacterium]